MSRGWHGYVSGSFFDSKLRFPEETVTGWGSSGQIEVSQYKKSAGTYKYMVLFQPLLKIKAA